VGEGKSVCRTDWNQLTVQHRLVGAARQGNFHGGRQNGRRCGQLDATEVNEALDRRRSRIRVGDMMVGCAFVAGVMV
jgi:hypothetical protein